MARGSGPRAPHTRGRDEHVAEHDERNAEPLLHAEHLVQHDEADDRRPHRVRPDELRAVHAAVKIPVLVGSGLTADNLKTYLPLADAFIVGSHFKRDGYWENPLDPARIRRLLDALA